MVMPFQTVYLRLNQAGTTALCTLNLIWFQTWNLIRLNSIIVNAHKQYHQGSAWHDVWNGPLWPGCSLNWVLYKHSLRSEDFLKCYMDHPTEGSLLRMENTGRALENPSEGKKRLQKLPLILRNFIQPGTELAKFYYMIWTSLTLESK